MPSTLLDKRLDFLVSNLNGNVVAVVRTDNPKTEGDAFASPLIFDVKSSYFFLALFFFAFFLVAMFLFSLSIFHGCGSLKKTAIDECIELLKIEVKKKIDVILDCRLTVAEEF